MVKLKLIFTLNPPTNINIYFSCSASRHTKKAIPFSLALLLRRVCSTEEVYNRRASELRPTKNI